MNRPKPGPATGMPLDMAGKLPPLRTGGSGRLRPEGKLGLTQPGFPVQKGCIILN